MIMSHGHPQAPRRILLMKTALKNKSKALGAQRSFHSLFPAAVSIEPNFPSVNLPVDRHILFLLKSHDFARCLMVYVHVV